MRKPALIPIKAKHRFHLDVDQEPVAWCSTEPYMNYQVPANPRLVRDWKDVTCGFCHHLLSITDRRPIDRHLKAVN